MSSEKICSKCWKFFSKTAEFFYRNKAQPDGFCGYCKTCHNESTKKTYHSNLEASRAQRKRWRDNNKERVRELDRRWKAENTDRVRSYELKTEYGINLDDYNHLLEKQNGVCAICSNKYRSGKNLAVDHDHQTGQVRGLLCADCNRAIGMMQDSPERLRTAARYLEF